MHTTRLCTCSVFSTTRTLSPSAPAMPSSAIAAVPSASRRSLNAGSTHARATTRAPWCGPMRCSRCSTNASMASVLVRPASPSAASSAIVRSSNSDRARRDPGVSWWEWSWLVRQRRPPRPAASRYSSLRSTRTVNGGSPPGPHRSIEENATVYSAATSSSPPGHRVVAAHRLDAPGDAAHVARAAVVVLGVAPAAHDDACRRRRTAARSPAAARSALVITRSTQPAQLVVDDHGRRGVRIGGEQVATSAAGRRA